MSKVILAALIIKRRGFRMIKIVLTLITLVSSISMAQRTVVEVCSEKSVSGQRYIDKIIIAQGVAKIEMDPKTGQSVRILPASWLVGYYSNSRSEKKLYYGNAASETVQHRSGGTMVRGLTMFGEKNEVFQNVSITVTAKEVILIENNRVVLKGAPIPCPAQM